MQPARAEAQIRCLAIVRRSHFREQRLLRIVGLAPECRDVLADELDPGAFEYALDGAVDLHDHAG